MAKTKTHDAEISNANILARATKFRVHLFLGVGRYARSESNSLEAAVDAAKRLEAEHANGRKALIYGVAADGRQALYTPDEPQAQQEIPMAKTKTEATKPAGKKAPAKKAATKGTAKPKAAQPRPARAAAAKEKALGKRAAIEAAARAGKLPPEPDFSAETHKRFRGKLAEVTTLINAGDVKALKSYKINPVSSSPKALARYRDLAVIALEARTGAAREARRIEAAADPKPDAQGQQDAKGEHSAPTA